MVDSGPCPCGLGEVRFRAYCGGCGWQAPDRLTASEAAQDCMTHNRRKRHNPARAKYAALRLTHTHSGNTQPIQGEHTNA